MVSSGYTFLSSHILKILSIDLETEGSLQAREKRLAEFVRPASLLLTQEPKEFSPKSDSTSGLESTHPQMLARVQTKTGGPLSVTYRRKRNAQHRGSKLRATFLNLRARKQSKEATKTPPS